MNDALKFGGILLLGIAIGRAMSDIQVTINPTLNVDATVPVAVDNVQVKPFREKPFGQPQSTASKIIFGTKK